MSVSHSTLHASGESPAEPAKPRHWITGWRWIERSNVWHVTSTTVLAGQALTVEGRNRDLLCALEEAASKRADFEALESFAAGGDL